MKSLRELNPDARYLRGRLRNIAWLYGMAALAATALGFALGPVHSGLTEYEGDIDVPPDLATMLEAGDATAADRWPVECFNVYMKGDWRADGRRSTVMEPTEAMLVERLAPDRIEAEMRDALIVGTSEQRWKVMAILERHSGETTRRLLKTASRDLDPELAARARALLETR